MTWEHVDTPPTVPSGEQEQAEKKTSSQSGATNPQDEWPTPPFTFAFVSRVGGEGVSIETILTAVTEEAVCVVDALQTLSSFTVTVPDRVGVDIIAALAGAASSTWPAPTQRVSEEAVIAELTAFTCQRTNIRRRTRSSGSPRTSVPSGTGRTRGPRRTVGADHLSAFQDNGAGRSSRAGTRLAVSRCPARGVTIETVFTAFAAQTSRVVLAVARSWTDGRQPVSKQADAATAGRRRAVPVSGLQASL